MRDVGLVLEDSHERAALMYQRLPNSDSFIWTETAADAIGVLTDYKERLFYVTLDHDLGGEHWVDSRKENTGMEVVRFLEKQDPAEYGDCLLCVHSWNNVAAPRMYERLKAAGYNVIYKPFGL